MIDKKKNQNFDFGKNWEAFIHHINEYTIKEATGSLQGALALESFKGKSFLDVGCGSGLFSLAAMRLNAEEVYSFDCSTKSINGTRTLKYRYYRGSENWVIKQGSVLDTKFLFEIGTFDIVYSWGVLHHTGQMWQALENVVPFVRKGGKLFIAIYNDQGMFSQMWKKVKKFHVGLPSWIKPVYVFSIMMIFEIRHCLRKMLSRRKLERTQRKRGMNKYHDWVDWVGGWPFEVAKPEEIFEFYHRRGFQLEYLKTAGGGHGNNEFIFKKD